MSECGEGLRVSVATKESFLWNYSQPHTHFMPLRSQANIIIVPRMDPLWFTDFKETEIVRKKIKEKNSPCVHKHKLAFTLPVMLIMYCIFPHLFYLLIQTHLFYLSFIISFSLTSNLKAHMWLKSPRVILSFISYYCVWP